MSQNRTETQNWPFCIADPSFPVSSNTQPHETRWSAPQKAEIDDPFSVALLSYPLGVRILRTNEAGMPQPHRRHKRLRSAA